MIKLMTNKDDAENHLYRGNAQNVNIPIAKELYDQIRFIGYNYKKDGYKATINDDVTIELLDGDML